MSGKHIFTYVVPHEVSSSQCGGPNSECDSETYVDLLNTTITIFGHDSRDM